MTKVDQFESVFKSAVKTVYEHKTLSTKTVLVLTDLEERDAATFGERVKRFLAAVDDDTQWIALPGSGFDSVRALLDVVAEHAPDLVVTYRSLHSQAWPWTYTLGRYVDVLAQELPMPILLLPNPHAEAEAPESFTGGMPDYEKTGTRCVMALTDHLTGAHRLVNVAAHMTAKDGTLVLAHVEDDLVFDRYLDAISKVPSIDTENARETIRKQLLKEPHDYVRSCGETLRAAGVALKVEEVVTMGHHLAEVKRLVDEHAAELLVIQTKDEDQMAMHGLAYPLVVELRHVPILML